MAQYRCGFNDSPGVSGSDLLALWGPTLYVNIGFDPAYTGPPAVPIPAIAQVEALLDTGAQECCIDTFLAAQLSLPVIDKRPMSGSAGQHEVDVYLAQIHVPALSFTMYGAFAGVHLQAGGQRHKALIGRSFLRAFTVTYEGRTGTVTISS